MVLKRFTVSLEEELIAAIRDAAKAEGMSQSAFMSEAAGARVRSWMLRVAIRELDPWDDDKANDILIASRKPDFWARGR